MRQHDLKRHAKIHSGVKPYPCLCGNSFARHDALTRHRQRGMCVGAFEGVVKKVAKRGRPRKHRPEAEARADKAARTRAKAVAMSHSSSSASEHSLYPTSPAMYDDSVSSGSMSPLEMLTHGFQPHDAEAHEGLEAREYTPPTSPIGGIEKYMTPEALEAMSSEHVSPAASTAEHVSLAMLSSPGKSASSQYNTPPELCLSSSSTCDSRLFDAAGRSGDARTSCRLG